ncbi:hypothetical protein Ngar_c07910 [Candidatus Nitrososphaera gargensis Ga9.2]|uniref:Uncharacterized protein n=1 Tax=Nitrososphaera gargensis (strain Ga9.2) TaxID=1237085 RepID=K0IG01_NITGG|nr:hypothetical protein Ngar_c07910 [Candidatus Nitrososphaera gargensis Ga9.2]
MGACLLFFMFNNNNTTTFSTSPLLVGVYISLVQSNLFPC